MAKIIGVKYFNTLIVKGDKPESLGGQWHIEESRIKGGFNDDFIDLGVKAYLVNPDFTEENLEEDLVASGLYNEFTGVNNINQFSLANPIRKNIANGKGSIQKLFAEDTNLLVFQEEKVSFVLVNKNAIFTAQGGNLTTSGSEFFNQVNSYAGDYGISKNPESFAYYAGRKYFTDKAKGAVLRLSRDGITEISNYGMRSFFRKNLTKAVNLYGMWDMYDKKYLLSVQGEDLVINGDFYNGSNNWTLVNDVTVTSDGAAFLNTDTDAATSVTQSNVFEIGKTYRIYYQIRSYTTGRLRIPFVGVNDSGGTDLTTSIGRHFIDVEAFTTDLKIERKTDPTTITIDNIAVSEIDNTFTRLNSQPIIKGENEFSVAFDDGNNGWTSFFSYCSRGNGGSIDSNFYTFKPTASNVSAIWKHYTNSIVNTFHGIQDNSTIEFIFNNNPSISKNFLTLSYEGSSGWSATDIETDTDTGANIANYDVNNQDLIISAFQKLHNKYFSNIVNTSSAAANEVVFGESISGIKGFFMKIRIKVLTNDFKELFAVSTNYNKNIS
jgi:hypothetical protein